MTLWLDISVIFCVVYFVGMIVDLIVESVYQWWRRG